MAVWRNLGFSSPHPPADSEPPARLKLDDQAAALSQKIKKGGTWQLGFGGERRILLRFRLRQFDDSRSDIGILQNAQLCAQLSTLLASKIRRLRDPVLRIPVEG